MRKKVKEAIPIQDAMSNLAALAEMNPGHLGPIGLLEGTKIVTEDSELSQVRGAAWLSAEGSEAVLYVLDATYEAVLAHLEQGELSLEEKGVAALMALAAESAEKLEAFLTLRMGKALSQPIQERPSFLALQAFYRKAKARWEEEEEFSLEGQEEKALEEALKGDRSYELFSLSKEEGEPCYDPSKLQKLRLTVHFDTDGESFEEDPLLQVRSMLDRDAHASARQILDVCHPYLEDFFRAYRKSPELDLAEALSMAFLALFLAANGRHLIQNTSQKSCLLYFKDFHRFVRRAMKTDAYQKWIAYPPEKEEDGAHLFLFLTHLLARAFFTRPGGVKQEMIGLVHRSMRRGKELEKKKGISHTHFSKKWANLAAEDASLRSLLARFPDGPLFKILDTIQEQKESDSEPVFDPLLQDNFPCKLYEAPIGKKRVHVLRVPSPTRQALLDKAFIVEEMRGFLRSLSDKKQNLVYLFVNLQDAEDPGAAARIKAIEGLAKSAEFKNQMPLLSLPVGTLFYHQGGSFAKHGDAKAFFRSFLEEMENPLSGYRFPVPKDFLAPLLEEIHRERFEKKETLSREERQDFIELAHHFIVLHVLKELKADFLSFTCKDGVDAGAAFSASFYVFTKGEASSKEEMDHLRWLLYFPALLVRERAIDPERFLRTLSLLERL